MENNITVQRLLNSTTKVVVTSNVQEVCLRFNGILHLFAHSHQLPTLDHRLSNGLPRM